ncbi:5-formyltetrahydrofolate cyclo-ligase [Shivajiella indica]|uniref:5-formyltetrahydrofolate cyclo-ligase n=1 Tax=Shivajiella indica TaxID=872115 RepID=A0ABW5B3R7_9BACT
MNKETIRSHFKQKRGELSKEEVRSLSDQIISLFLEFLSSKENINHIHLFLPIDRFNEVDTFPLFFKLQEKGLHIYTSIVNKAKDNLDTLEITNNTRFVNDAWGIPLPAEAMRVSPENIQLILVPLLAYDRRGYRLGYGKGYYDKYLAGMGNQVLKVGLSFFDPIDWIPEEAHDIPLDLCITQNGILNF